MSHIKIDIRLNLELQLSITLKFKEHVFQISKTYHHTLKIIIQNRFKNKFDL